MVAVKVSEIGHLPEKDSWAFEALKELFAREKGFDLEAYKERCILRRIYLKVRSRGFSDLGSYYRALSADPRELDDLFQYLTINVTEFFRNPSAFHYLERNVIPRIIAERGSGKRFNIWSAGCSSGEEPYSLAISMMRVRRRHRLDVPFEVLATDIDQAILQKAHRGNFRGESLKNLEEGEIREFFTPEGDGYTVREEVKECVVFRKGDLLRDEPGRKNNLIVCRNLLIYFSREKQEGVISEFSRNLEDGGYLMLGKAETLIGKNRHYFQSVSPTERIYRLRPVPLTDNI